MILRRRSRSCASWLLAFFLFIAPAVGLAQARKEAEQLDALRARIERLRQDISATEESHVEARDQLRESERAISNANRALRVLGARRNAAGARLNSLVREGQALEAEIASRQQILGRWLTLLYLNGERGHLRLLLSGGNPANVARELHYYGYVSRAQVVFIQELRASLARQRELEALAREASNEIAAIDSAQRRERSALLREQSERRKVVSRVSTQLREQRRQVKYLERDESRLSRLVEELSKVLATTALPRNEKIPEAGGAERAFEGMKGKLRLPIRGELSNRFGAPRSSGGPTWKGLFIRSAAGQEVRAVASGRVVFSDWLRGFGNLLIIDHGQGYLTIYGNNESVLKQVGEAVRGGDIVATVGASGGNTESGLYFEIRYKGKPSDPMLWVSLK